MMVNVCRRLLFCVSCSTLFFSNPCVGFSPIFPTHYQAFVQQDTITRDTVQRVAKGLVEDNEGRPLAGVTINIKGSEVKTQTDDQGAYEIISPTDTAAMLVFSLLGFEPFEMPMSIANGQTVTLQPQASDPDGSATVVVTGYGTER